MYENPTLFPQISNRESWVQTVQIFDDDTGDLITLTDNNDNALYAVTLEIRPSRSRGGFYGVPPTPYYDNGSGEPMIYSTLAQGSPAIKSGNYISIIDTGTINIQVPKSRMQTLRRSGTWDVFMTIDDTANDDGRQILIGKLPVFFGGRNT